MKNNYKIKKEGYYAGSKYWDLKEVLVKDINKVLNENIKCKVFGKVRMEVACGVTCLNGGVAVEIDYHFNRFK